MVRMETLVLFPALTLLAIVAPVLIPWFFGDQWTSAIVPAQILAIGGAATLVIDTVGAGLMATGRGRALLGYGWGHFAAYAAAVVIASRSASWPSLWRGNSARCVRLRRIFAFASGSRRQRGWAAPSRLQRVVGRHSARHRFMCRDGDAHGPACAWLVECSIPAVGVHGYRDGSRCCDISRGVAIALSKLTAQSG